MTSAQLKVTLVCHSPNAEPLLGAAAKLCYATDTDGLFDQDAAAARRFVRMLRELGHLSPIEHASFTFYLEGVSRAMTHQLVRHRLASYSQRSQRYVDHATFDYVIPPQLEGLTPWPPGPPARGPGGIEREPPVHPEGPTPALPPATYPSRACL